jgi:hypothetical protein
MDNIKLKNNTIWEESTVLKKLNKLKIKSWLNSSYGWLDPLFIWLTYKQVNEIKDHKIVDVQYSSLYINDTSFINEYKENHETISWKEIEKLEEEKNEYYKWEFWLGMKHLVNLWDYEYKVHKDLDNKEFIVEYGFNKVTNKFIYPIDFSKELETKLKRYLLFWSKPLQKWSNLKYIWDTNDFEIKGNSYRVLEVIKWSERPYEVSCEDWIHNWWTAPICSWTLEEIQKNFIIIN